MWKLLARPYGPVTSQQQKKREVNSMPSKVKQCESCTGNYLNAFMLSSLHWQTFTNQSVWSTSEIVQALALWYFSAHYLPT